MPIGHGAFAPVGQARIGKSVLARRAERGEDFRAYALGDSADPRPSGKASLQVVLVSVPQTDTGRLG